MARKWEGQTAVVLASGPSLDVHRLRIVSHAHHAGKCKTLAVNATGLALAHFDAVYGGDFLFWKMYQQKIKKAQPQAELWTQDRSASERFQLNHVRSINKDGLGVGTAIHLGGNSGYQAVNLAYLWGAAKIVLLGFDMREVNGEKHWHDDHPRPMTQNQCFDEWTWKFRTIAEDLKARGVDVVNCTPQSALSWFRVGDIETELQ